MSVCHDSFGHETSLSGVSKCYRIVANGEDQQACHKSCSYAGCTNGNSYCSHNAQLARIENQQVNDWVASKFVTSDGTCSATDTSGCLWLSPTSGMDWRNYNTDVSGFENWAANEPAAGTQMCAVMGVGGTGKWKAVKCKGVHARCLCEDQMESSPPTPPLPPPPSAPSAAGAIIGASAGGVAGLALLVIGAMWLRRRCAQRRTSTAASNIPGGLKDVPKMTEGIAVTQPDQSTAIAHNPV